MTKNMNNEELSYWFINKISSCYPVKPIINNKYIFWYYDDQFIRKIKIGKINKQKVNNPKEINGFCLFEQDIINKEICFDYNEIWSVFYENYSNNFEDIQFLMIDALKSTEFKSFTPVKYMSMSMSVLTKKEKIQIKTKIKIILSKNQLKQKLKLKEKKKKNMLILPSYYFKFTKLKLSQYMFSEFAEVGVDQENYSEIYIPN